MKEPSHQPFVHRKYIKFVRIRENIKEPERKKLKKHDKNESEVTTASTILQNMITPGRTDSKVVEQYLANFTNQSDQQN